MRRVSRNIPTSIRLATAASTSLLRCCSTTTPKPPQNADAKEERKVDDVKEPLSSNQDSVKQEAPTNDISAAASSSSSDLQTPEAEPQRWVQAPYEDPDLKPIKDEHGNYIVSPGNWPTGEVAYQTPPPPDKLAPRFGYNVLQVRKDVSWWQHYHKYPRLSVSYINIHFWFIIVAAWLGAFLTEEYRRTVDEMKTPGALVGEHRGRGPSTKQTQKVSFTPEEMNALVNTAQTNWVDGKGEQSFIGSKDYRMKQIGRPKEFSIEDVRKR